MSCECDKLRELYERFSSEHLEAICSARNHLDYSNAELFKPTYEQEVKQDGYATNQKNYNIEPLTQYYDVAPAKMSYVPKQKTKQRQDFSMLEQMIKKAKAEEEKWTLTMK
ncbi:hypothetical protein D6777_02130 [Candidatus Woesearchaeota archaeon]|nr:MAG: hypothetical protein D6777_02130 [Candidatus Woesearchaeota archaeon]